MLQKKMFKVLTRTGNQGPNGGGRWMRVGTGFENRDQSVNIVLDVFPKTFELHLREYDEEDNRKREERAAGAVSTRVPPPHLDTPFRPPAAAGTNAPPL